MTKSTFIDDEKNDSFSSLRGIDLQELLLQVESFLLEYRNGLNLPNDLTFGIEIEYEGLSRIKTDKFVKKNFSDWASDTDGTLMSGGEIISPIMTDNFKYWQELQKICKYLSRKGADTTHRAGGHIHIGTCGLGSGIDAWRQFLKLYMLYESVIFRFVNGDKINGRKEQTRFASPIADYLHCRLGNINSATSLQDIRNTLMSMHFKEIHHLTRYTAINFTNVDFKNPDYNYEKNTIEFRSPNATTNAIIWQNNINAFAKILLVSKSGKLDEDFLDYKLENEFVPYTGNEYLYDIVNLKEVLEFVDLVFDNNIDKVYFLRQYLKNFQDGFGLKAAVKAKKFTR